MITTAYRGGSTRAGIPGWWVSFSYSEDLVARLKARIPPTDREWNPVRREWWIAHYQQDVLLELLPGMAAFIAQPQLF